MQQHVALDVAGHGHSSADHAGGHHWEVSWAPMAISFGTMFLVPLTFVFALVYKMPLVAILCAGIGTPLVLAGIARWVHEGATQPSAISNVSPVGVGVFIIGEIFIFLGLFASYWMMRLSAGDAWPPPGTPHIGTTLPIIMTFILVGSSITYHKAEELYEHGDKKGFLTWVVISMVLGAAFLGCTIYEYSHLIHQNFTPATNQFSAAFYSLTGFHGSHVIVGLACFLFVIIGALRGGLHKMFVKVAGIYWHFVDVVWFFVASQVYFW
ncbi:MAG: heme-copper oxidase subunit III [Hyphomicrobium sp.]|nr:heme-copper oxidase subunit III [Hyphomicrobium sp.]